MPKVYFKNKKKMISTTVLRVDRLSYVWRQGVQRAALEGGFAGCVQVG